ncbi:MAG: DUF3179 domain-containing protein [Desulfobacterales bacterium]|nr:DUF3179 domain-containing protein [Desulfobacterales bacterium]
MYSRYVDGKEYTFGVSGRLYKSNVLLYDHQTDSLWSQLMKKAISGPLAGKKLQMVLSGRMKWKTWKKNSPATLVLSEDTGYARNYSIDPYEGYYRAGALMFPVGDVRRDFSAKDRILGIEVDNHAKAYSLDWLSKNPGVHEDMLGDHPIRIEVSPHGEILAVKDAMGQPIPATYSYWFAWQAFHYDTEVFKK